MVIFDGKGDLEFFHGLFRTFTAPAVLQDLRLLNPARPEFLSCTTRFIPTTTTTWPRSTWSSAVFNLHDEFFAKHQLNYLADIVRVLTYTGSASTSTTSSSWRSMKRCSANRWRKPAIGSSGFIDQHSAAAQFPDVGEESVSSRLKTGSEFRRSKDCSTSA